MLKINPYYSLLLAIALFSNNCPLLSSQINSQNDLKRTCNGLAIYYQDMGIKDYYDSDGIGLFTKWFNQEEMEIDEMDEELQDDNAADCGYLEFDENFPLKEQIDDENEKQTKIFKIIQNCYIRGNPYNNGSEANTSVTVNNEDKDIRSFIEEKGWEKVTPGNLNSVIHSGALAVLKYWKEKGEHIKVLYDGNNALHLACQEKGNVQIVTYLLDVCRFPLEAKGKNLMTAFLCAAEEDNLDALKALKVRGANIYAKDKDGNNALHLACQGKGNVKIITWLLDMCRFPLEAEGKNLMTPFLCAAEGGNHPVLMLLRARKANIDAKDKDNYNALHYACWGKGDVKIVTWLLDMCGLPLEAEGKKLMTAFLCAAEGGNLPVLMLLKARGTNIYAEDSDSDDILRGIRSSSNPLHYACKYSSVEVINWLLDACNLSKLINAKDLDHKTPFHCAAEGGNLPVLKLLWQRGADWKVIGNYRNALHYACQGEDSPETVNWLLDVCELNIEAKGGVNKRTPFLWAAEAGNLQVLKTLKARRANVNAKDLHNKNALHFACQGKGTTETVTWLLDACGLNEVYGGRTLYAKRTPFLCAAKGGNLDALKALKKRGANIYAKDAYGQTALHLACDEKGTTEIVTWLLDVCKLNIEAKGRAYQRTPFLWAAYYNNLPVLQLLAARLKKMYKQKKYYAVTNKVGIYAIDQSNNTALNLGVLKKPEKPETIAYLQFIYLNQPSKVEKNDLRNELLTFGYIRVFKSEKNNKNIPDNIKNLCLKFNKRDWPPTYIAWNFLERFKNPCPYMIQIVAIDLALYKVENIQDKEGKTPFHYAAERGDLQAVKLLKARGANIYAADNYGNNALHWASFNGDFKTINWLIDKCALDLEARNNEGLTPFFIAAQRGNIDALKALKQKSAKIYATDKFGNNALHAACFNGYLETINWLIDECALNLEARNNEGQTLFHYAAERGDLQAVKLLKARGANIYATDNYGSNALHWACFSGDLETINSLIDVYNLSIEAKNNDGITPFLIAAQSGNLQVLKALATRLEKMYKDIDAAAEKVGIYAKDEDGYNALHWASWNGRDECVRELLKYKGLKTDKNNDELTPLDLVQQKNHERVVHFLTNTG